MSATRGSALKVSRSSFDISPANAPMRSHLWVIFDEHNSSVENVLTLEDPWSCLRVTIYRPGRGLSALEIRKRGEGAARAERVQRARAMSWGENIIEKLATGDHRERNERGGLNAKRDLPEGWRRASGGTISVFKCTELDTGSP